MPDGLVGQQLAAGRRRRAAAAVAAPVLVLLAPGRLHHDPAGDGHGLRHHRHASPASRCSATSRWSTRIAGIAGLGFIVWGHHMFQSGMNPRAGHDVHGLDDDDRPARRPSRSSTGWARSGAATSSSPRRCSTPWRSWRCSSSAACRASSWPPRRSTCYIHDTYFIVAHIHYVLFGGSTFGIFGGDLLLVPEDVRPDDERDAGARSTSS